MGSRRLFLFNFLPFCEDVPLGCGERRMARCGGETSVPAVGVRRLCTFRSAVHSSPSAGSDAEQELGGTTTQRTPWYVRSRTDAVTPQMAVRRPRNRMAA